MNPCPKDYGYGFLVRDIAIPKNLAKPVFPHPTGFLSDFFGGRTKILVVFCHDSKCRIGLESDHNMQIKYVFFFDFTVVFLVNSTKLKSCGHLAARSSGVQECLI